MGSWHFEDRRGTKRELQRFGSIGVERRAELSEMSVWGVPTGMPQEGKSDMERIGLFKEMGYIGVGDKYTPFTNGAFNESAQKRKQMLCGFPKKKCGLQVGYFDNSFKRIFEKEASTDPVKLRRLHRIQQAKKNLGTAFVPSDGGKRPSGVGGYYGTLGGTVPAMSALQIPRRPYKSPGKNILTSPPKKGTGYGYPNVTLSKMEPYPPEPYGRSQEAIKKEMRADRAKMKGGAFRLNLHPKEYFDTNPFKPDKSLPAAKTSEAKESSSSVPFKPSSPCKKMGGMKAGTFDTYPSHSADPYRPRKAASVPSGKVFRLCAGPKSMPFKSIVDMNVGRVVNGTNYRTVMV